MKKNGFFFSIFIVLGFICISSLNAQSENNINNQMHKLLDEYNYDHVDENAKLEEIKRLLKKGGDINAVGRGVFYGLYPGNVEYERARMTILIHALFNGYFHIAEYLIINGADILTDGDGDSNGDAVLEYVALLRIGSQKSDKCKKYLMERGKAKLYRMLLERGAKLNISDDSLFTLLMTEAIKADSRKSKRVKWPLGYDFNKLTEPIDVLLEYGADPNIQGKESGKTALHWAVLYKNWDVAKALLRGGADPTIKDYNGTGFYSEWELPKKVELPLKPKTALEYAPFCKRIMLQNYIKKLEREKKKLKEDTKK